MYCRLNDVPIGRTVIIKEIKSDSGSRSRMIDIGIIPDSEITPIFKSALSDPRAYLVKGAIIALRDEDTKNINVISGNW